MLGLVVFETEEVMLDVCVKDDVSDWDDDWLEVKICELVGLGDSN